MEQTNLFGESETIPENTESRYRHLLNSNGMSEKDMQDAEKRAVEIWNSDERPSDCSLFELTVAIALERRSG